MNKPKNIPEIIGLLQELWVRNPDLRLMQLLINVVNPCADLYHLKDDVLEAKLHAALDTPTGQLNCDNTDFLQIDDERKCI
jgi:uncharacterized protein YihD (DUF1040 family)